MDFKRFILVHRDHQVKNGLLAKALHMIVSDEKEGKNIIDFGNPIGFSELVPVAGDEEFYEQVRGNRPYPSRFVKNRLPIECSKLFIRWRRINDEIIQVITAYFTAYDNLDCPDEPANILRKCKKGHYYSPAELKEAHDFWATHAFVEQTVKVRDAE